MEPLQVVYLSAGRTDLRNALSALPDAPVVPYIEPAWRRGRQRAATVLRRAADILAPPVRIASSRLTLSVGTGSRTRSGGAAWDGSPCRPSPTA
jgi:hypothetical protein